MGRRRFMKKLGAAVLVLGLLTSAAGCSADSSVPERATATQLTEQTESLAALLEGTLGSVTEGDKVYFYVTDEFDLTWGLILPLGSTASEDGQTLRFKGQEQASVGDRVGVGGGGFEATEDSSINSDIADLWEAKHEVDGLWLSSMVEKSQG